MTIRATDEENEPTLDAFFEKQKDNPELLQLLTADGRSVTGVERGSLKYKIRCPTLKSLSTLHDTLLDNHFMQLCESYIEEDMLDLLVRTDQQILSISLDSMDYLRSWAYLSYKELSKYNKE